MKSEMEDLCLQYSDPKGYNEVLEKINESTKLSCKFIYNPRINKISHDFFYYFHT